RARADGAGGQPIRRRTGGAADRRHSRGPDPMTALAFAALAISIGLMYVLGARMFSSARFGIVPVALFALTPLLWRQSQNAPASLDPLPFVVGWLLAVAHFQRAHAKGWPVVAGGLLGVGVYTSHA